MPAMLQNYSPSQQADFEDRAFHAWMKKVDLALIAKCGLTNRDLSDICYRDLHDSGASAYEAAMEALANEGFED